LRTAFSTGNICYTTPLIAFGRAYCGSGDRHLYAIDLDSLTLAARRDLGARIYAAPRQVGDRVIVGTLGGVVRELDPNSLQTLGRLQVADAVANAIAATSSGSVIYVPTTMGAVHAFARL
jgi:outer membrane protein assembly factor BamB